MTWEFFKLCGFIFMCGYWGTILILWLTLIAKRLLEYGRYRANYREAVRDEIAWICEEIESDNARD